MMPSRTICEVLCEMRACHETRNYSYLNGLIEEGQTMANRMEASIYDMKWNEDKIKARLEEVRKRSDE